MVRFSIHYNGCVWFFNTLALVLQHVHYTDWQYVGINLVRDDYETISDVTDLNHVNLVDAFQHYIKNPRFKDSITSATHPYFNIMGRIHAAAQLGKAKNKAVFYHPPAEEPTELHPDTLGYLSRHQSGPDFHASTVNPLLPVIPERGPKIIQRQTMPTPALQDDEDVRVAVEYAANPGAIVVDLDPNGVYVMTIPQALQGAAGGEDGAAGGEDGAEGGEDDTEGEEGAARGRRSARRGRGYARDTSPTPSSTRAVSRGSRSTRDRTPPPPAPAARTRNPHHPSTPSALSVAVQGGITAATMCLLGGSGIRGAAAGLLVGTATALFTYGSIGAPASQDDLDDAGDGENGENGENNAVIDIEQGRVITLVEDNLLTISLPDTPTQEEIDWYQNRLQEAIQGGMNYLVLDHHNNIVNHHMEPSQETGEVRPVPPSPSRPTGASGAAGAAAIARSNRRNLLCPRGRGNGRR